MGVGLILYLFICILLIVASLLNQSQSGGLGILSGSSNTLLGSTQSTFLSKVISFLAVIFFIGALVFSIISSGERTVLDNVSPDTPIEELEAPPTDIIEDDALDLSPTLEETPGNDSTEEELVPLTPIEE